MLVLPRYPGVELQVHDPETFVAHRQDAIRHTFDMAIAQASGSTIVRAVGITLWDNNDFTTLNQVLNRTEDEFAKAAELCGVDVIPHEWGLFPLAETAPDTYNRYRPTGNTADLLPKDHILVAEVGIVRDAEEPKHDDLVQIHTGLDNYYVRGAFQLFDLRRTGQIVKGRCDIGSDTNRVRGNKLVDIEPRFRATS